MSRTRHMQRRMSQRSIGDKCVETMKTFGHRSGDKIIFNKKACQDVMTNLRSLLNTVQKMYERGGFVMVDVNGTEITTYALDSYRR